MPVLFKPTQIQSCGSLTFHAASLRLQRVTPLHQPLPHCTSILELALNIKMPLTVNTPSGRVLRVIRAAPSVSGTSKEADVELMWFGVEAPSHHWCICSTNSRAECKTNHGKICRALLCIIYCHVPAWNSHMSQLIRCISRDAQRQHEWDEAAGRPSSSRHILQPEGAQASCSGQSSVTEPAPGEYARWSLPGRCLEEDILPPA